MTERPLPDQRSTRGRPDHHNPLGQVAGAPPALSPLTLRLVLAIFGLLSCAGFAAAAEMVRVHWLAIALIVLAAVAAVAAVEIVVIARRTRRGESPADHDV